MFILKGFAAELRRRFHTNPAYCVQTYSWTWLFGLSAHATDTLTAAANHIHNSPTVQRI
jgi:hypothetical protein